MLDKKKVQNKRFNRRENNGVGRGVGGEGRGHRVSGTMPFGGGGGGA